MDYTAIHTDRSPWVVKELDIRNITKFLESMLQLSVGILLRESREGTDSDDGNIGLLLPGPHSQIALEKEVFCDCTFHNYFFINTYSNSLTIFPWARASWHCH